MHFLVLPIDVSKFRRYILCVFVAVNDRSFRHPLFHWTRLHRKLPCRAYSSTHCPQKCIDQELEAHSPMDERGTSPQKQTIWSRARICDRNVKDPTPNVTDCLAIQSKFIFLCAHQSTDITTNVHAVFLGRPMYPYKDDIYRPRITLEVCTWYFLKTTRNLSLILMVFWVLNLKVWKIDSVDDIPVTSDCIRMTNTVHCHKIVCWSIRKPSNCTGKPDIWWDWTIRNESIWSSLWPHTRII